MKTHQGNKGFTLMELMIVITIIGILAALTGGVVSVVMKQNKVEAAKAAILRISMALEQYYNDNGAYPPTPADRAGNASVIAALTGDLNMDGVYDPAPGSGDIPRTHPRWRRPYLQVDRAQMDGRMNMVDPWRQPYRYFENEREAPRFKVNPNSFLLFSYGPDMKATAGTREEAIDPTLPYNKDNVKNWEDE